MAGGTFGIGRAITLTLARRGWRVIAFGLESRQPSSIAENAIPGLRAALAQIETFMALLAHSAYSLEPLTYTTACLFERCGREIGDADVPGQPLALRLGERTHGFGKWRVSGRGSVISMFARGRLSSFGGYPLSYHSRKAASG
mgnify:CR=1 FL=1